MKIDTSRLTAALTRGLRLAETPMGITAKGSLTEAKGWKEMVEDISDPYKKAFVANMLENYRHSRAGLDEASTTINVGNWDKFSFPMLSIVSESLIAQDLVSVQALDGPSGLIFYMNFVTGQNKGSTAKGSKIWDALTGHADRNIDSSDRVNDEILGVVATDAVEGSIAYSPVIPGTVTVLADNVQYRDGSDGILYNVANVAKGTVDYSTGLISISDTGLPADGTTAVASYNYQPELNAEAQQVDFDIQSRPIYAQERKLRGRWSMEAAQALESLHKVNAENMVSQAITNHLQWEIDREIIEDLRRQASAGVFSWSAQIPAGSYISYTEHKLSFFDALVGASSFIQRATNRAKANWGLFGVQGCNIIETLPGFDAESDSAEIEGAHLLGKLGRMKIYSDPRFPVDEGLLGYKGRDFIRAGYVFAPWILLFSTPMLTLDDFINRKGFASQYGKAMINSKLYSRIKLSNAPVSFGG